MYYETAHPQVVTLSKMPLVSTPGLSSSLSSHTNLHELTTSISIYEEDINFFYVRRHPILFLWKFKHDLQSLARHIYNDTTVRNLYDIRKEFDIVLIDGIFNEVTRNYQFLNWL